ncbi:hypothetical protein HY065_00335, partial [Candidatus Berkelbacteria bacterium]|nr:hypothetical protein [Candidatus Berkelbacteria bacterium]
MKKILYLVFGLFVIGLLVGVAPHPVRAETVSGTFTTEPALFGGGVYAGNFTFSLTPSPQAGQSSTFQIDFTTPTIFGYHAVVVNDVSQCFPDSEHIDYRQQHDTDRQGGPQYALRPGIVTLVLLNSPGQETQSGRWRASFSKVFPGNAVGRICEYQLVNWSGTFGAQHGGWWPITPSLFTPPPTLNFSISPTSVTSGQNFTLIWTSAYATTITTSRSPVSCPDAGGFFPVAGGSTPLTAQTVATSTICTYTATANGPGGTSPPVSRQVTVNPLPVLAPTVKLEAKGPTSDFNDTAVTVKTGETFILRWSSTNAGSLRAFVSANPASVGCPDAGTPLLPFWPFTLWRFFDPPAGGTQVLSAPASPVECTYYATASGNGTAVTDQVLVRVIAPLPPLVVICSAGPNPANISQEVTW